MDSSYSIAVMSDETYESLVAEVIFQDKDVGLILSQEVSKDQFEIAVFSLIDKSREAFFETQKVDRVTIALDQFLAAVDAAKHRLLQLDEE